MHSTTHSPEAQNTEFEPAPSTMRQDVARATAMADGSNYRERYTFDQATGTIRSDNVDHSPIPIQWSNENGQMTAYLGGLATGGAIRGTATYYDAEDLITGQWSSMWDRQDGKYDMRRAYKYWKQDELVYKCIKLLTQLANSQIQIDCDDENFQSIVRIWIETAMSHSFRDMWFREYYRSGMVVQLATLVPYLSRNFKPGKIPKGVENRVVANGESQYCCPKCQSTDIHGRSPKMKETERWRGSLMCWSCQYRSATGAFTYNQARAQKTAQLMEEAQAAEKAYKDAAALLKQYREAHAQGLCSDQRLAIQSSVVVRKQYEWLKGMVPVHYTILNPLSIDIEGPEAIAGLRQPFLEITDELETAIRNPTPQQSAFVDALPIEIVDQVRGGAKKVWLSPNICTITTPDKQDYETYPIPMVAHAFKALEQKQRLMEADERTANSVRDRILKVTVGSEAWPVHTDEPVRKIAAIFANPSPSLTIYWNHTLAIEWIEPPLDSFMDTKRYNLCDDRIRTCFGISRIFTGTSESAGAIGNSIMNFKGLEEEVTSAQDAFLQMLKNQIRLLKQALGVSHEVTVRFLKLNLRDESEFIAALQQLVQNGILDPQTALETLGYHFPTVLARLKKIKKLRDGQELFLPLPSSNNMGPDAGQPTGGRPKNKPGSNTNTKTKKGKSQPKKAKAARLMSPAPGQAYMVLDTDEISDEDRQGMSTALGCQPDWIMTAAQYTERFKQKVAFVTPLPMLDPFESAKATRASIKVLASMEERFNTLCDQWKADNHTEGKRGPYLTPAVRDDLRTQAFADQQGWREKDFEHLYKNDAEEFDRRCEACNDEYEQRLLQDGVEMEEARVMSRVATRMRIRKELDNQKAESSISQENAA